MSGSLALQRLVTSALAIGHGALLLFGGILLWHLALLANAVLSPEIPWFVVAAVGAAYFATRYVSRQEAIKSRLALGSMTGWALVFGVSGSIACLSIAIVEGSLAGLPLGPLMATIEAPPLFSNLAILLVPVYAAVIEELAFRGVIQIRLEGLLGTKAAIAIATLLFLGVHLQKADFAAQWFFYLTFSLTLGIVAARFRSLALCVVLHLALNFVSVAVTWAFGPFRLGELHLGARVAVAVLGISAAGLAILALRNARTSAATEVHKEIRRDGSIGR